MEYESIVSRKGAKDAKLNIEVPELSLDLEPFVQRRTSNLEQIFFGDSGLGGQCDQYAPGPLNTAGIVFMRINRSNPRDHLSM
jgi:hypothetical protein